MIFSDPSYLPMYLDLDAPPIPLISDHYMDSLYKDFEDEMFAKASVRFSLFSLKEKEYGSMILAHEMGHHFSHLHMGGEFSPQTAEYVDKSKECIKSRYDKFQARTGKDACNFYLEEEFADEFQFSLKGLNSKLLFCPTLTIQTADQLSMEIMGSADNHPEDLWRSLNQMRHLGKEVPPSCKELILKNTDNYEYKNCL